MNNRRQRVRFAVLFNPSTIFWILWGIGVRLSWMWLLFKERICDCVSRIFYVQNELTHSLRRRNLTWCSVLCYSCTLKLLKSDHFESLGHYDLKNYLLASFTQGSASCFWTMGYWYLSIQKRFLRLFILYAGSCYTISPLCLNRVSYARAMA